MNLNDTICALSTPPGMGAIATVRLSGSQSAAILEAIFKPFGKRHDPARAQGYQMLFGRIMQEQKILDEVMVALYRQPHSYTGEDVVEISCHGSLYIQEQLLRLLQKQGARLAEPGEFTLRAYWNGKIDLSQAEGVADLIASENEASHQVALQQMRGSFSQEIQDLREQLIHFAAMIELELDFGEEDVEFANREELEQLLDQIEAVIKRLLSSYHTGNVLKNGVPVAIVGAPNAGKSTLLNALLREDRAIVTAVAGTTRDAIEDVITLEGVAFRFIDTAGIRVTDDLVESLGIEKTYEKIALSRVVLYLYDAARAQEDPQLIEREIHTLQERSGKTPLFLVANKIDTLTPGAVQQPFADRHEHYYPISALRQTGLEELTRGLIDALDLQSWKNTSTTIVTNARHFHALEASLADIQQVQTGLHEGRSGDLLAFDLRQAIRHLGSIIGEIDMDQDVLGAIFGKFCIGK